LYEEVIRANGYCKVKLIRQISEASKTDWRAGAWLLSHLYPDEYGDKKKYPKRLRIILMPK